MKEIDQMTHELEMKRVFHLCAKWNIFKRLDTIDSEDTSKLKQLMKNYGMDICIWNYFSDKSTVTYQIKYDDFTLLATVLFVGSSTNTYQPIDITFHDFSDIRARWLIKATKEITSFINTLTPSKVSSGTYSKQEELIDIYSYGHCLNFAVMLYLAFKDKYHCTIVGRGRTDYKCINRLTKCVIHNQFNHYLLKITDDITDKFEMFDICGRDCVDDYSQKYWISTLKDFEKVCTDVIDNKKEDVGIFKEFDPKSEEFKELCKEWNIPTEYL